MRGLGVMVSSKSAFTKRNSPSRSLSYGLRVPSTFLQLRGYGNRGGRHVSPTAVGAAAAADAKTTKL